MQKTMIADTVRRLVLYTPDLYDQVKLNKQQMEVCTAVRNYCESSITTEELTGITGWSKQHARRILKELYRKGYLDRHQYVQPSGGLAYLYNFRENLKENSHDD